jgi:hypothetical protein
MSQVPIACRWILFPATYFLLLTCLAQAATGQVRFTNLKEKYTELKVEPVLVNEASQPISVPTADGIVEVSILYLDRRTKVRSRNEGTGVDRFVSIYDVLPTGRSYNETIAQDILIS